LISKKTIHTANKQLLDTSTKTKILDMNSSKYNYTRHDKTAGSHKQEQVRPKTAVSDASSACSWKPHFRKPKSIVKDQEMNTCDTSQIEKVSKSMYMTSQWAQSCRSASHAFDNLASVYEQRQSTASAHRKSKTVPQVMIEEKIDQVITYVADSNGKSIDEIQSVPKGFMDQSSRPCTSQPRGYLSPSIPEYYNPESITQKTKSIPRFEQQNDFVRISIHRTKNDESNFVLLNVVQCAKRPRTTRPRPKVVEPKVSHKRQNHGTIQYAMPYQGFI
jgi:hypothetical protein